MFLTSIPNTSIKFLTVNSETYDEKNGTTPKRLEFCITALQSICKNILITELIYTIIILKFEVGKFYLVKESFRTSPQEKNVFNQMERVLKFYISTNSTCFECPCFWGLHVSCTFKKHA